MKTFESFDSTRIFPAIDLRGGRCVRLVRGRKDAEIDYDEDPIAVARRWIEAGAECLHLVDLGAAFGEAPSTEVILRIAATVDVPIQAGGGVRDAERAGQLLGGGITRVILGTRAFRDPEFLAALIARHGPERIMVSLDCEGDRVRVAGWEEDSELDVDAGLALVRRAGAQSLLVTATDRDGTFEGARRDLIEQVLVDADVRVVAAGGIGALDHVRELLDLRHPRLEGIVVGRALYEGRVDLAAAIELSRSF